MTITAKIIADSVSPEGIRLVTVQTRYPKFIHGEVMTHRVFSRNASSSRAIPVERLIKDVTDDPVMPMFWGKNQPGMQAAEELNESEKRMAIGLWLDGCDRAIHIAQTLANIGAHKQIVNRIIEPWCHINTLISSTSWANFNALRIHAAAQPEIHVLAKAIETAMVESIPIKLNPELDWHLPYVGMSDHAELGYMGDPDRWMRMVKISVARCARVSYLTQEGKEPNIEDDLKLYDRLVGSEPLHASPAEHQATPDSRNLQGSVNACYVDWSHSNQHGNFHGWRQFRKMLKNEYVEDERYS